ncbi:MAG: hypothetical protein ABIG32_00870 [Candidatus Uhrbacteria bacterium]|nr:hypothetical protein [Patescibacteria group bacterium]MBU1907115.1 hypothetical protein [Patescibacteria group bacterium]
MASKTPKYDAKVKAILDATEPGERTCELTGEKWMMDQTEIDWYRKFNVPPSDRAPYTRWKIRAGFFMGAQILHNTDCKTGQPLLTHIHPATNWKVMNDRDWHQEDFSSLGQEIDLKAPVFDQMLKLSELVPINASRNFLEPVNSVALCSLGDENSYFCVGTQSKRSFYCTDGLEYEDSMEVFLSGQVVRSYNVLHSYRISDSRAVRESRDCFNCNFIFDCRNCEYCFGAWNKRNKKYLWWNEQLSEAEWKKRFNEIDLGRRSVFQENFDQFKEAIKNQAIWPENFNVKSESSSGEYLTDCVDCNHAYYGEKANHASWGCWYNNARDCYQCDGPFASDCYEFSVMIKCQDCKFCWTCSESIGCEYSINCYNCENCFGCIGLKRKKFHIFNKKYSEKEYWSRVDELKCAMLECGEYGKFFPWTFSQSYIPDTGGRWIFGMEIDDYDKYGLPDYNLSDAGAFGPLAERLNQARDPADIPDSVDDADESWVNVPILDKELGRPYSVTANELQYCKKYRVPISQHHFSNKMWPVFLEMNLAVADQQTCGQCGLKINVARNKAYPKRTVYCHDCYLMYIEQHG